MLSTAWQALFGATVTPQEQLASLRSEIAYALRNCSQRCDEMMEKMKEHEERMCHLIRKKKIDLARHETKLFILYQAKVGQIYELKSEIEQLGLEMQEMEALSNLMKLRERSAKIMARYNNWMSTHRLMNINTLQESMERAREDNEVILSSTRQQQQLSIGRGIAIDVLIQNEIDRRIGTLSDPQSIKIPKSEVISSSSSENEEADQLSTRLNTLKNRGFNE